MDISSRKPEIDKILSRYSGLQSPEPHLDYKNNKISVSKHPVDNRSKHNTKHKHKKATELGKKIVDMKNSTTETLQKKKSKKKATNYEFKHKKGSMPSECIVPKTLTVDSRINVVTDTTQKFRNNQNVQLNSARNHGNAPKHANSKSEHCLSHRVGLLQKPEAENMLNYFGNDKSPFFSTYEQNAQGFLDTPPRSYETENFNHDADLRYDSETCEVSFSNEKVEKTRRRKAPVFLTSRILKYYD